MHLESFFSKHDRESDSVPATLTERLDLALGTEEIDEIIRKSVSANTGNKKGNGPYKKKYKPAVSVSKPSSRAAGPKTEKYLLVDGYNVIFAWKELSELAKDNIDSARGRLLDLMCNYRGFVRSSIIVVFDAYRLKEHPTEYIDYHNIHVVYTKTAETADRYIERFANRHSEEYDITVVTSDGLEQIIIRGEGCSLISSREFEKTVENTIKEGISSNGGEGGKNGIFYMGDVMPPISDD